MDRLLARRVLSTGSLVRGSFLTNSRTLFKHELQLCHMIKPSFMLSATRLYHHSYRLMDEEKKPILTTSERLRLTKNKFLAQATGPISRLMVRVKWLLQRNNKPFSIDDISAMFSWLVMGNVLWIVLGTTTFGLVLLYSLHTFDRVTNQILAYFSHDDNDNNDGSNEKPKKTKDEGIVGYLTSAILSNGLGIKIEFQKKSVLPEFKDGKLIFNNLNVLSLDKDATSLTFDCNIQTLKLSLSFGKWYDGNGLIQDLEISGLKGKIFKSSGKSLKVPAIENENPVVFKRYLDSVHFQFDMNDQTDEVVEPMKSNKMDANYELSSVKIRDSSLEIYDSPEVIEPLRVSIFNCELPKVTGKSLLVDFFNADNVTGSINESMFTIHKRQDYDYEKQTIRFKLDGIDMGNLAQRNPQLKFNWILNGKAEVLADIRFPSSPEDNPRFMIEYRAISDMFSKLLYDIGAINSSTIKTTHDNNDNNETQLMKGALHAMYETFDKNDSNDKNLIHPNESTAEYVFINVKVKFSQLQATLPKSLPLATTGSIPFITLHDLRSLVSYINKLDNDNRPPIVVNTMVIEKLSDLYNIDHLTEAKVFDIIVSDIYDEFLKMVKLDEQRIINERSSLWSHSLSSQLLLLGLGVIV